MNHFLNALCLLGHRTGVELATASLRAHMGGDSVVEALQAAARCGLPTRLLRLQASAILPPTLPCLLLLTPADSADTAAVLEPRACVLVGLDTTNDSAQVIFPETEPAVTTLALSELQALHTGEVVFPNREELAVHRHRENTMHADGGWLYRILWHYAPLYRDVALSAVFINILALASPLFIMNVYDRVIPHNAMVTLWVLAAGVALAAVTDGVLRALRAWYVDMAGRHVDVVISTLLLQRVLRARLDACPESAGELAHTLESFENLRETLGSTTLLALLELPFVLLFIALMAWLGGALALLPLLAAPCMVLSGLLLQGPFRRSARETQKCNAQRHAVLTEVLAGLETAKGNLLGPSLLSRYESAVEASARSRLHARRLGTVAAQSVHVVTALTSVGMVVAGAYSIAAGHLSVGALVACIILLGRCLGPLTQLAGLLGQWQKTKASLRLLDAVMALPEETEGHAALPGGPLGYELQQVTLRHARADEADPPVIRNLSLRIAPGERVGIVGGIGSGKTTLARLLMGLHSPTEGRVRLGDVDIHHVEPEQMRSRVGYLAQEVVLFTGSVRENIALGLSLPDNTSVEQAAEVAGVMDFVRQHPKGLDMPAGERGRRLSGGQRQAVAMARALVRNPQVLILDEPASHLDPGAEQRLVGRLARIMGDRTLVLFTHRPAMLALVNRLLVLDKGTVILDGPRDLVMQQLQAPVAGTEVARG